MSLEEYSKIMLLVHLPCEFEIVTEFLDTAVFLKINSVHNTSYKKHYGQIGTHV